MESFDYVLKKELCHAHACEECYYNKKKIYHKIKSYYEDTELMLEGLYYSNKKRKEGDSFIEPQKPPRVMVYPFPSSDEEFEERWKKLKHEQNLILQFFLEKDMLLLFFEDYPQHDNVSFFRRMFY